MQRVYIKILRIIQLLHRNNMLLVDEKTRTNKYIIYNLKIHKSFGMNINKRIVKHVQLGYSFNVTTKLID